MVFDPILLGFLRDRAFLRGLNICTNVVWPDLVNETNPYLCSQFRASIGWRSICSIVALNYLLQWDWQYRLSAFGVRILRYRDSLAVGHPLSSVVSTGSLRLIVGLQKL